MTGKYYIECITIFFASLMFKNSKECNFIFYLFIYRLDVDLIFVR